MLDKFEKIEKRCHELEGLLADPRTMADKNQYQRLAKELSDITPAINVLRSHRKTVEQIQSLKKLLEEKHDKEFEELARLELHDLQGRLKDLEKQLEDFLNPASQEPDKDIIIEIRAGTGGQEAALFAADLYRMYTKYAARMNWKADSMSSHIAEAGGLKEVIFSISGKGASRRLKWESGVHRVQRVPTTEA